VEKFGAAAAGEAPRGASPAATNSVRGDNYPDTGGYPKGIKGCKAGQKFGEKYLYKKWKKACENLKIKELDLYGGTRHTTATELSKLLTPEQIKKGTLHSTNKAFERYFQAHSMNAKLVYQTDRDYNIPTTKIPLPTTRKIVSSQKVRANEK